jgi:hypothetical protein
MATATHSSSDKSQPAVSGTHATGGVGVSGTSDQGRGVEGRSTKGVGVVGVSTDYRGIEGHSTNEHAVLGKSTKGAGVAGISTDNRGVIGRSTNEHGVFGESAKGAGVAGFSEGYRGISGRSTAGQGVWGASSSSAGVVGASESGEGVRGTSTSSTGVAGESGRGVGVLGRSMTGLAGQFEGAVRVTGDITCKGDIVLEGADYAEAFTPAHGDIAPGTVVSLDDDGRIGPCTREYDGRVAGVVSGAMGVRPGIVLDRHEGGVAVAMIGKIWALADATQGPIRVGDLLTTSATPGHAQRVSDGTRALGAVIGKALTNLPSGRGLVRVLVSAT